MILYFIRHGQTSWNVANKIQGSCDTLLDATGISQAYDLGTKLKDTNVFIRKIYSSRQKRASQTAQIISQTMEKEYILIDGLEEINCGNWEGLTWSEVKAKFPKEYNEWYTNRRYYTLPNGESYEQVLARVLKTLHKIIAENKEDVAIVTHSAVIMCLKCYVTNTPFDQMSHFKLGNTSITEIDSNDI